MADSILSKAEEEPSIQGTCQSGSVGMIDRLIEEARKMPRNKFFTDKWDGPTHWSQTKDWPPWPKVVKEIKEEDVMKFMKSYWDEYQAKKKPWPRPSDSVFDDPYNFSPCGSKPDKEAWLKYLEQRWESDDFDIQDIPLNCMGVDLVDYYVQYMHYPRVKEEVDMLSRTALRKYNRYNNEEYEFEKVINVTAYPSTRTTYNITFEVKNTKAGEASNLETFQTQAWHGIDEFKVMLCRPKPSKRTD